MICASCNSSERGVVRVLETRLWRGMILRRRLCKACGNRWVTLEVPREEWLEREKE